MSIIYVGRCLTTNKVYVGSTLQGKRRVFSHQRDLEKDIHSNKYLQNAWNKYTKGDFVWHVVEECESSQLQIREQWWIDFLRAADERYGFNLCNPAARPNSSSLSKSQIELWRDPEIKQKRLTGLRKLHKDGEWKNNRAKALAAKWQNPEWREKMLKVLKRNSENLTARCNTDPAFKKQRMRGIQPT